MHAIGPSTRPSTHALSRACRRLLAGIALTLLFGCQDHSPEAPFENYLQRLGHTLSMEAASPQPSMLPRPPRSGQLQLELPSGSLDTLDFLALSGCAVQVTLGKRNSSLGRLAKSSQRLLLDLEYLRLAPACVTQLQTNKRHALASTLQQAWELKQTQLPALIFNATLAADEYRAFWQSTPTPGDFPRVAPGTSLAALGAINSLARRWLQGDYQADNRGFEILLSEVAGGDGGVLLRDLARQSDWLASADQLLQQRMKQGPLCARDIRHRGADILPTVVRKYFIGELQPPAAAMQRRYHQIMPAITDLETQLGSVLPPDYVRWRDARNALFTEFTAAPRRHVETLQRIQQPCVREG